MGARALVMLVAVSLVWPLAAARAQQQSTVAELQKFQGTWAMVLAEADGRPLLDEDARRSRIAFVGDKVELVASNEHKSTVVASIAKLDVNKSPNEMHWVRTVGPNAGSTLIAVYEFDGPDTYKVCFNHAGLAVPKSFATTEGSGNICQTWQRVKP